VILLPLGGFLIGAGWLVGLVSITNAERTLSGCPHGNATGVLMSAAALLTARGSGIGLRAS